MHILETARLKFIPFSYELIKAALEDRTRLAELLEVHVPEAWPYGEFAEALPSILAALEKEPDKHAWGGLIVQREEDILIGDMGFHRAPDASGTVEIGYSLITTHHGRGYATEMATALVAWAFKQPEITRIIAEFQVQNIASQRVLEKIGMHFVEQRGATSLWEMRRATP
ncbi:MAG TPA: GNAT family N-acetyltransferase [Ktedonobacteraceae bacterium]|nr:GNAT family N-acetyltransferase [Ktedonobacteraceae bacterium]